MTAPNSSTEDLTAKHVSFEELAPAKYGYTAEGDPNPGVVIGDESVLIVDAQATPAMAQYVIARIRNFTDKPMNCPQIWTAERDLEMWRVPGRLHPIGFGGCKGVVGCLLITPDSDVRAAPRTLDNGYNGNDMSQGTSALSPRPSQIEIAALIDRSRVGAFQLGMLVLCGLCLIMDGFDVQAMGYVAPALLAEWGIPRAALGPVFGAGLFGMVVGALVLSMLADRFGRRPVLIGATLFFAVCMLATPEAGTVGELTVVRFITGLGLGGIMPNAMALAGEYSPRRVRVTVMMVISCGFTVGAALGGLVSVALIASFGWRAVFYFGGTVPLVLAVLMIFLLPESLQLMVLRGRNPALVHRWLRRIDPSVPLASDTELVVHEPAKGGAPVVDLFREGRAGVTALLWVINFMNLINLYFLSNWLPTIVNAAGYTQSTAVLAGTALQVGGTVGTLAMGRLIDRVGFRRVLIPSFTVAAVTIALIGQPGIGIALLFTAISITGFCVVGGQPAVNALAASYYPTALRATGVGWSLGIGRFGSILGPVIGGALIGLQWPNSWLFMAAAVPALISGLMMVCLGLWKTDVPVTDIAAGARGDSAQAPASADAGRRAVDPPTRC